FDASAEELGKNLGDDLAEGKATLPLIYAMAKGSDKQRNVIRNAILEGGLEHLAEIQQVIEATGALDYTEMKARQAADMAIQDLDAIQDSEYKQSLIEIAGFAVRRRA
ncbi:MAG: polyprenyl synthetase family protein, partial [Proteobacteria bacterium]|nr:polyprenyl synthetase family protein [Pseudomonadota bacterium]